MTPPLESYYAVCDRCGKDATMWTERDGINYTVRLKKTKEGTYRCTMCDPSLDVFTPVSSKKNASKQTSLF